MSDDMIPYPPGSEQEPEDLARGPRVFKLETRARARPLMLEPERVQAFDADRAGLLAWIGSHFVQGADFGKATSHGGAKDTLLKPGAEKLCLLFGWTARLSNDAEVREMLGNPPSLIAFYCELVDEQGQLVAEGRGACDLNERPPRATNSAIKIAEKRAVVDAVLRACGLSELFTQDLEDMGLAEVRDEQAEGRVFGASGSAPRAPAGVDRSQIRSDLLEEIIDLQFHLGIKDAALQGAINRDFQPGAGGKERKLTDLNNEELGVLRDKMSAPRAKQGGKA